jgi:hypothetical protein
METVIIVGAVWISLIIICLWFCYRFQQFLATKKRDLSLKVPLQQKVTMSGTGR